MLFLYFCLVIPLGFVGVGGRPSFYSVSETLLQHRSITDFFSSLSLSRPSPEVSDENSGPMSSGIEIATTHFFSDLEAKIVNTASELEFFLSHVLGPSPDTSDEQSGLILQIAEPIWIIPRCKNISLDIGTVTVIKNERSELILSFLKDTWFFQVIGMFQYRDQEKKI